MSNPQGLAEPTADERQMAMIAHLSGCFTWLLGPVLIFLIKSDSPYVKYHATQAIMYHLVAGIAFQVLLTVTFGFGCPLILGFWAIAAWVGIAKANKGLWDAYPGVTAIGLPGPT